MTATDAAAPAELRADQLSVAVLLTMGLAVGQRAIGFARTLLLCRFLDEGQLGQWSLAFSFLMLAAPIAMLGLTGSFGRYVEHFHRRGHLRTFLRRTTGVALLLGAVAVSAICFVPDVFGWLIFRDQQQVTLVIALGLALIAVIAFNYFAEFFRSLRKAKVVSAMELLSSMIFAGLGLSLVYWFELGTLGVVIAYGVGNLVACGCAFWLLKRTWQAIPEPVTALGQRGLWGKLIPFAAWVWVINLVYNLFDLADRYMIVHFSGLEAAESQRLVGQYFSSLAVPLLLVALAELLSNLLLPYLSHDWEAGRHEQVGRQLNLGIKLTGLLMLTGAVMILVASPLIFGWALDGKYDDGLHILPWTIAFCIWGSMSLMAQNYLWCKERAKLGCLAVFLALLVNVGLNRLLLPWLGLLGAVLATAAANGFALALILAFIRRLGMRLDQRVWLIAALPLTLPVGTLFAVVVWLVVVCATLRSRWILSALEREQLLQVIFGTFDRVGWVRLGRRPIAS